MSECSADPVGRPYTVIGEAELLRLGAPELAERLSLVVKANEIRFIKDNVEEGKKDQPHRKTLRDILNIKRAWKSMVVMQRKALKFTGLSRFAKTRPDEEQGTDTKAEACHLCWLLLVGTERSYSTEIRMVLSIVYV
ncbi:unnamed protein product [Cladocopium goreaui]|uniref:Polyamine transporter RMV1 n=1 Tax=Cladocopium goreaui TaxID=2562237 RepID=A0A9P1GRA0_9DINO|nr:unnamed protein product [Cladocopium goreaui]